MLKKICISLITSLLIIGICINSNATEIKTSLEVIQMKSETKYLENKQGSIEKQIISSDSEKGEVKVQVKINNTATKVEEQKYDDTEILIIIPESIASKEEKLNEYVKYIETLSKNIFEKNSKTKIGIVGMQGTIADVTYDEVGNATFGPKDESNVKGKESNAEIVLSPTSNVEQIKNGIKSMNSSKTRYRNNLQAAIRLARKSYSENKNKLLICLYDNVPEIAIGVESRITYGGLLSPYKTALEAATAKHQQLSKNTKSEILELKKSNIEFILLRPADTSYDKQYYDSTTGKPTLKFDGSPYVKEIYGTLENPTYGKMYSLNNNNLEKIVTEYIYTDIMQKVGADMTKVSIKEYLSKEILNNFDIIIEKNKVTDGCITWNIEKLENNKNQTFEYTIKIKDMKNSELLDKIISISEKLECTYKDYTNKEVLATQTDSPKIKLAQKKEENNEPQDNGEDKKENKPITTPISEPKGDTNNKEYKYTKDETIAKETLPYTGIETIIIGIATLTIFTIISYKKYKNYKDVK